MANRKVTHTDKDLNGNIIRLCNPSAYWSPVSTAQAIADIELGTHTYYVAGYNYTEVQIQVITGRYGKYLRTDPDGTPLNNLDNLPDC